MNQITAAELSKVLDFKATFNALLYDGPFGNRMSVYLYRITDKPLVEINDPRECTASLIRRVISLIDEADSHLVAP